MKRRVHRRKSVLDPLVAIDGGQLAQALRLRGLGVREAARQLKVTPQTLMYVISGKQRRVRLGLFRGLVALLRGGLSAAQFGMVLSGQATALPANVRRPLLTGPDLDAHLKQSGASDEITLIGGGAFQVALRDATDLWAKLLRRDDPLTILGRVQRLYHPGIWRAALFAESRDTTSEELDEAAEAASRFWRVIFQGGAEARRDALHRLARVFPDVLTGLVLRRSHSKSSRPRRLT